MIMIIWVEVMSAPKTLKVLGVNSVGNEARIRANKGKALGKFSKNMESTYSCDQRSDHSKVYCAEVCKQSPQSLTAISASASIAINMIIPTISIGNVPSI